MSLAPLPILAKVDSTLLETFFEDAIAIMERDQYVEVNVLTPAITRAQALVPGELRQKYIKALLGQANSGAYQGGPAAIAALSTLPEGLRAAAFETLDARALRWAFFDKAVKQFLTVNRSFWPPERQEIYSDYFDLSVLDFAAKHDPGGF
jgi:hypothetical protein